jgi:hypothetical protein
MSGQCTDCMQFTESVFRGYVAGYYLMSIFGAEGL